MLLQAEGNALVEEKEEMNTEVQNLKQTLEFTTDETERNEILDNLFNLKLESTTFDDRIEAKKTAYEEMKAQHDRERAQEKQDDKATADKEKKEAEFNARAGEIIAAYTRLGEEMSKFEARMGEKQEELDAEVALNERREPLKRMYEELSDVMNQFGPDGDANAMATAFLDSMDDKYPDMAADIRLALADPENSEYGLKDLVDHIFSITDESDYAIDENRENLLRDYVDVYRQAIDGLQIQIDNAKVEFELISEEKKLKEEQAEAEAAKKAKENEYEDTRTAVNEAKRDMDQAQKDYNEAAAKLAECDPAAKDCSPLEEEEKLAQEELDLANENFNSVDERFQYINEELRLKEDEARQRALNQQRTAVFNMVKNDGNLVEGVVMTLQERINSLNKRITQLGGVPVAWNSEGVKGPAEGYEKEYWAMRVMKKMKVVIFEDFAGADHSIAENKASFVSKVLERIGEMSKLPEGLLDELKAALED